MINFKGALFFFNFIRVLSVKLKYAVLVLYYLLSFPNLQCNGLKA